MKWIFTKLRGCNLHFSIFFIKKKRWKRGCSYILANEGVQSSLRTLLLSLVKSFSIAIRCEWKILSQGLYEYYETLKTTLGNISLQLSNSFWQILHVFLVPFVLSRSHTPFIRGIDHLDMCCWFFTRGTATRGHILHKCMNSCFILML